MSDSALVNIDNTSEDEKVKAQIDSSFTDEISEKVRPTLAMVDALSQEGFNDIMSTKNYSNNQFDASNMRNIFADAYMAIDADSESDTEEQRKEKDKLRLQKADALRTINAITALCHNGDKSKFNDWYVQTSKQLQTDFKDLTVEQRQAIQTSWLMDEYKKATDSYGTLPKSILSSDSFSKYVDPEAYKYYAAAHNVAHENGIIDHFVRSFKQGMAEAVSLKKFRNGETTLEEHKKELEIINNYYFSPEDSKVATATYKMMSNLVTPFTENPVNTLIAGGIGIGLGAMGSPQLGSFFFSAMTIGNESAVLSQASIASALMDANPNMTREEALSEASGYALAVGFLDTAGFGILTKASGVDQLVKKGFISLATRTGLNKLVKETGKKEIADRAALTFTEIAKNTAIDIGKFSARMSGVGVAETGIESVQDVLEKIPVNKQLGVEGKANLKDLIQTGVESFKENLLPMIYMGFLITTPRGMAVATTRVRDVFSVYNDAQQRVADEVNAASPINEQNKQAGEEVAESVIPSKVLINVADAKQKIKDANLSEAVTGDFVDKLNKVQNGDPLVMTRAQYAGLHQDLRDVVGDCVTDSEGNKTPKEVSEFYSEKKLSEMREQLDRQIPEYEKRRDEQVEIEKDIYKQLIGKTKDINAEQINNLAHLTSLYVTSLAHVTGKDAQSIYKEYKPRYTLNNETNLTSKPEEINNKNITATFNRRTNEIQFKKDTDFASVFHETAHWYLETLRNLAKENADIAEKLEELGRWAGYKDVANLNDKDFNTLQDKFVAGFVSSLIAGKNKTSEFKDFRRFLSSVRNYSLFSLFDQTKQKESNSGKSNTELKEQHIKEGYESTYKDVLPAYNQDFANFINTMFASDTLSEMQELSYNSRSNILDQIDNWSLNENDKTVIKDSLKSTLKETNNVIDNQIDVISFKQAMSEMTKGGKKFAMFLKDVINDAPENVKNKSAYIKYLNKLIKASEEFETTSEQIQQQLKQTPLYQYLEEYLPGIKLNQNGLEKAQIEKLKKKGLIGENEGVDVQDLIQKVGEMPQEIQTYLLNSKESDKAQALLKYLLTVPTSKELADAQAKETIKGYFEKDIVDDYAKLQVDIAKVHKSISKATLFGMAKAMGTDTKQVDANLKMIQQICEQDVKAQIYSESKVNTYHSNAARENRNAMKAFASGEASRIADGIRHLRNEFYQNHKAQHVTELKTDFNNRIDRLKKIALWGRDKTKSNGYDADYNDLLRHILYQVGITRRVPTQTIEDIQTAIVDKYPREEKKINDIIKKLNDDHTLETYWENQTFAQLEDTIETCEAICESSKNLTTALVNDKRVSLQEIIGKLENAKGFKAAKNKLASLKTGEKSRSTTRKAPRFDKILKSLGVYKGSTMMMEQFCQIMDREQLGFWHEFIYQSIKDGSVLQRETLHDKVELLQTALNEIKVIESQPIETELVLHGGDTWTIGAKNGRFANKTTFELLGICMHLGSNYHKFLDGYLEDTQEIANPEDRRAQLKWKEEKFENFFRRMVAQGHITKEMMNYCRVLWKVNEDIYPDAQKANRAINGYPFKKLETRKIKVEYPDGSVETYDAGYVPAMKNKDARIDPKKEPSITDAETYVRDNIPFKNPSFVQDRTAATYELELDPIILSSQIKETTRFAYVMPAVVNVEKAFRNEQFRNEFEAKFPGVYENVIQKWLSDVAKENTTKISNALEGHLNDFIRGASMQLMCLNTINTLQQIANAPSILTKVNMLEAFTSLGDYMVHPIAHYNEMMNESVFMQNRIRHRLTAIDEAFESLTVRASQYQNVLKKGFAYLKNANDFTVKNVFIAQSAFQNLIDMWGYRAAKKAAKRLGYNEQEQIRYAEMVVRTVFTSFDPEDTSGVQRSAPLIKAFTMFTGYFISMARLSEVEINIALDKYGMKDPVRYLSIAHAVFCAYVYPGLIAEMINSVGHGEWGDDEDGWESFALHLALSPLRQRTNALPFLNKGLDIMWDKVEGKEYYSSAMLSTPVLTILSSGLNTINKVATGKEIKGRDIRNGMMLAGAIFKIPLAGFVSRPIAHSYDIARGNVGDESMFDLINAMLTGTTAPRNRVN